MDIKEARRALGTGGETVTFSIDSATLAAADGLHFHIQSTGNGTFSTIVDPPSATLDPAQLAEALQTAEAAELLQASEVLGPVASHSTATSNDAWDAAAEEKKLPSPMPVATAKKMYAWIDASKVKDGEVAKSACKFPHAEVSADGKPGAANIKACQSGIGAVNGGRTKPDIPAADRKAVYSHLAAHIKDAGLKPPAFKENLEAAGATKEIFVMANDAHFAPATLDPKDRTVDVVWYGGATVPRIDPSTGDKYMLRLSMEGCRMDRLNSGAPFFDNHNDGTGLAAALTKKTGSTAQLATVRQAWADGPKGMATLQFPNEGHNQDADQMFDGIANGHFCNLSFGTWIYNKALESSTQNAAGDNMDTFVATDWEPYELSQSNVPADYTTTFLTALSEAVTESPADRQSVPAEEIRATAPITKEPPVMDTTTQAAGDKARELELAAAAKAAADLAIVQERERLSNIRAVLKPFTFDAAFVDEMLGSNLPLDTVRQKAMEKLATDGDKYITRTEHAGVTRGNRETRLACMEAAILKRSNDSIFRAADKDTPAVLQYKEQQDTMAREYLGFSLMEMAREVVELSGGKTRGLSKLDITALALIPRENHTQRFAMSGAESTSDFPSILANVANKTLRQAYEAWPQTFKAFSKPATAADFKPINRVQLNDLVSLPLLNEDGEYKRLNLNDSNATYSLTTRGGVVAITRKAIINDDLSAFTRTSATLGTAAARTQSDVVWGIITANANMADGNAIFSAAHKNYNTGAATSIDPTVNTGTNATIFALTNSRKGLRLQTAPNGTPLNLVNKYLLAPAALESYALQLVYPTQLAAAQVAGVVPGWILGLNVIIEPRLDAASSTGWYSVADPALIDTVEYCFLEGQEGVFYEMRQGFDVDGIEIKARIDFGAQVIDFRGLQFNRGT